MRDKFYKIRIYKDNRLTITLHDFIPFQQKAPIPALRPNAAKPILVNKNMTVRDYKRLLKANHRKLWDMDFEQEKCIFLTLTLDRDLDYPKINNEFHRFLVYVKRKCGKFEYIRTIELQETIPRFHIHTIFQFNTVPKIFDQALVEDLWGLGICNVKTVFDIRGVLQYITKFKKQHMQKGNSYLTCFPKGAKVISTSQHFGSKIGSHSYREETVTADHLKFILNFHFGKFEIGEGKFVRVDGHHFFNINTSEPDFCMDRIYIQSTKEFIDNNFISPSGSESKGD